MAGSSSFLEKMLVMTYAARLQKRKHNVLCFPFLFKYAYLAGRLCVRGTLPRHAASQDDIDTINGVFDSLVCPFPPRPGSSNGCMKTSWPWLGQTLYRSSKMHVIMREPLWGILLIFREQSQRQPTPVAKCSVARSRKTHFYQFPFISNRATSLFTVPSWIVSINILACSSIYFSMNSISGENIKKSSKKLTYRMIVRASVAKCSVRFASVLQISRWKIQHPTDGVLGTRTGTWVLLTAQWLLRTYFWKKKRKRLGTDMYTH